MTVTDPVHQATAAAPAPAPVPPQVGTIAGTGIITGLVGALAGSSATSHDITPITKAAEWALEKGLGPIVIAAGLVYVVWKLYLAKEHEAEARRTESMSLMREQLKQADAQNKLLGAIEPVLVRVCSLLEHDKDVIPEVKEVKSMLGRLLERTKGDAA